jgi:hypothetical protein
LVIKKKRIDPKKVIAAKFKIPLFTKNFDKKEIRAKLPYTNNISQP